MRISGLQELPIPFEAASISPLLNEEGRLRLSEAGTKEINMKELREHLIRYRKRRKTQECPAPFDEQTSRKLFVETFERELPGIKRLSDAFYI